ncbi:hypothetical protein EDEG_00153 [Edhazardia aedis USNM 41457]|uniref:Uncharacterized protein n=1 Tax=Edhazardia aedis (strain USNM 41457) TaxID=1003232 RepID=J9DSE3_EDHAE|nr:hypothetical protein EDEG_00153 [Edhazardia aedis USNM 41457]|eukprot:EJW04237.1 hypothetical protein EDEG_00153 [Edhazardia aedis USNM 41457]
MKYLILIVILVGFFIFTFCVAVKPKGNTRYNDVSPTRNCIESQGNIDNCVVNRTYRSHDDLNQTFSLSNKIYIHRDPNSFVFKPTEKQLNLLLPSCRIPKKKFFYKMLTKNVSININEDNIYLPVVFVLHSTNQKIINREYTATLEKNFNSIIYRLKNALHEKRKTKSNQYSIIADSQTKKHIPFRTFNKAVLNGVGSFLVDRCHAYIDSIPHFMECMNKKEAIKILKQNTKAINNIDFQWKRIRNEQNVLFITENRMKKFNRNKCHAFGIKIIRINANETDRS